MFVGIQWFSKTFCLHKLANNKTMYSFHVAKLLTPPVFENKKENKR